MLRPGGWFVFTEILTANRLDHLLRCLLPGLDLLGETALRACLADNGLDLEHWAPGEGGFLFPLSPMAYCTAVARLNRQWHAESETN